jgi:hypothetical protein
MPVDPRKKSIYIRGSMLEEMLAESKRLGNRSVSLLVYDAWQMSKAFAHGEPMPEGVLLWFDVAQPKGGTDEETTAGEGPAERGTDD